MKVIDLLNKIANDGKIPERIKYNDYEYRYHDKEHGYCRSGYDCTYICLDTEYYLFDILNDEVEIIEENNKIEYVGRTYDLTDFHKNYPEVAEMLRDLADKTIEIIDFINEGRNE